MYGLSDHKITYIAENLNSDWRTSDYDFIVDDDLIVTVGSPVGGIRPVLIFVFPHDLDYQITAQVITNYDEIFLYRIYDDFTHAEKLFLQQKPVKEFIEDDQRESYPESVWEIDLWDAFVIYNDYDNKP